MLLRDPYARLNPQQAAFRRQNVMRAATNYAKDTGNAGYGVLTPQAYENRVLSHQNQRARAGAPTGNTNQGGGNINVLGTNTSNSTDPAANVPYVSPAELAAQAKKAEEDAKRNSLRKEGNSYLDKLFAEYGAILEEIKKATADQRSRVNKSYDSKIGSQVENMNLGMYETDAAAAASNLADSSFRSFDRGRVRKVADENISTLNEARQNDLGEIGSMALRETRKYSGERSGIDRTRKLLNEEEDINALQGTVNSLDKTYRGMGSEKARFGTQGNYVQEASKYGNYDDSALISSLDAVVASTSATPAAKSATVKDIISGSNVDSKRKKELKNKYLQTV